MTTSEKYVKMNHAFIELRDAVFSDDAEDEKDWNDDVYQNVIAAFSILNGYLDYYKTENNCKTREKKDTSSKGNIISFPG